MLGPVASAPEAIALLGDNHPDAAILDVHLNGGTSEPVADAFRSQERPFLVLTAYNRGHLAGALRGAQLLNKPVDETKLRQALSALLQGDITS